MPCRGVTNAGSYANQDLMNATTDTDRSPNPVDLHVGGRIRMRRKLLGVSQERLADDLGLTFQQVQKYTM